MITETFRPCTIRTRTSGNTCLQVSCQSNSVYFSNWIVTRLYFCQQPIKKLLTLKQSESVFDKGHHLNGLTSINSMKKIKELRGKYTVHTHTHTHIIYLINFRKKKSSTVIQTLFLFIPFVLFSLWFYVRNIY